jgi:ribosomal protein S18 acetylase RimI-like enzyme
MILDTPTFEESAASADEICAHLRACDRNFIPRLSGRLDIQAYAEKIARHAETFEAWFEGRLVGLVAAYLNDRDRQNGFVTSVSVEELFMGQGIAFVLFKSCLATAQRRKLKSMTLDVHKDNKRAIGFYRKFDFQMMDTTDDNTRMNLSLVSSEYPAMTGTGRDRNWP